MEHRWLTEGSRRHRLPSSQDDPPLDYTVRRTAAQHFHDTLSCRFIPALSDLSTCRREGAVSHSSRSSETMDMMPTHQASRAGKGAVTRRVSYCRLCQASCGVLADVRDNRIQQIIGDKDNPMSRGFTCPKGRRGGDFLAAPDRLTHSLVQRVPGLRTPIDLAQAAGEIGAKLQAIIARHGPDAVGIFLGTQGIFATLTKPIAQSWFAGTGSHKQFSTMTIDQSAKWVAAGRIGKYLGGHQSFSDFDVWIFAGTNPLISVNGGAGDGVLMQNPYVALTEARAGGLKLIVIDPRRTETAYNADLHIRPRPGHDALIFAGLLNIILSERLHDQAFCDRYVHGLSTLTRAVGDATPERVALAAGIDAEDLLAAARLFARGPRGMVFAGTGVCMGPHSNLAEHLATCLNIICGRYLREGELASSNAVLGPDVVPRAEVAPPDRTWERGYRSRFGAGMIRGELPSNTLSDEILAPGPDRIRALIVSGGNPVLALPDGKEGPGRLLVARSAGHDRHASVGNGSFGRLCDCAYNVLRTGGP